MLKKSCTRLPTGRYYLGAAINDGTFTRYAYAKNTLFVRASASLGTSLALADTLWEESSSACSDDDGLLEAGECASLKVSLKSSSNVTNVTAKLVPADPSLVMQDDTLDFGNISSGQTRLSIDRAFFRVPEFSSSTPIRHFFFLLLVDYEDNGLPRYQRFILSNGFLAQGVCEPLFVVGSVEIDDSRDPGLDTNAPCRNNGDGIFQSYEVAYIRPQLCNLGTGTATEIEVALDYPDTSYFPFHSRPNPQNTIRYSDLATSDCRQATSCSMPLPGERGFRFYLVDGDYVGTIYFDLIVRYREQLEPVILRRAVAVPLNIPNGAPQFSSTAPRCEGQPCWDFGVRPPGMLSFDWTIANRGSGDMRITDVVANHSDITIPPEDRSFILSPGESRPIHISLDTSSLQDGTRIGPGHTERTVTVLTDGGTPCPRSIYTTLLIRGLVSNSVPYFVAPAPDGTPDYPDIDRSGRLVFAVTAEGGHDIYLYDAKERHMQQITAAPGYQLYPKIYHDVIAWEDGRNGQGEPRQIYVYNIPEKIEFPAHPTSRDQQLIGIDSYAAGDRSAPIVAFLQTDYIVPRRIGAPHRVKNLYIKDLASGTVTQVTGYQNPQRGQPLRTLDLPCEYSSEFSDGVIVLYEMAYAWDWVQDFLSTSYR